MPLWPNRLPLARTQHSEWLSNVYMGFRRSLQLAAAFRLPAHVTSWATAMVATYPESAYRKFGQSDEFDLLTEGSVKDYFA